MMTADNKRRRFVSNAIWIMAGNVMHMIIAFIIGIYSARYLGPSNYGLLNFSASLIAIASAFSSLGFSNTIIKYLVSEKESEGEILGTAVFFRLLASMISLGAILVIVVILRPGNRVLMTVALFQSIGVVFQSFGIFTQWFQSRLRSKVSSMIATAAYFVTSLFRLYLLLSNKSVEWFAAASIVEYAVDAILLAWFYFADGGMRLCVSWKRGIEMLNTSYHFIISSFMVIAYTQMDKFMLSTMIGDAYTGNYSVAIGLCDAWTFVLGALIDSAAPLIYEAKHNNNSNYERKIKQLNSAVILIAGIVAILISFSARFIILFLYKEEYILAVTPFRILAWYSLFQYLGRIRTIWATCEGYQKYEKHISVIGLIANAILNYVLIRLMGINGAAWATLLTQIVSNIV